TLPRLSCPLPTCLVQYPPKKLDTPLRFAQNDSALRHALLLAVLEFLQQTFNLQALLGSVVENEIQLRRPSQPQPTRDLTPKIPCRRKEALNGVPLNLFTAQYGD